MRLCCYGFTSGNENESTVCVLTSGRKSRSSQSGQIYKNICGRDALPSQQTLKQLCYSFYLEKQKTKAQYYMQFWEITNWKQTQYKETLFLPMVAYGFQETILFLWLHKRFCLQSNRYMLIYWRNHLKTHEDTAHSAVAPLTTDRKAKTAEIIWVVYITPSILLEPAGWYLRRQDKIFNVFELSATKGEFVIITGRKSEANRKAVLSKSNHVDATVLNIISWQWLLPVAATSCNSFCCDSTCPSFPPVDLFIEVFLTPAQFSNEFVTVSGVVRGQTGFFPGGAADIFFICYTVAFCAFLDTYECLSKMQNMNYSFEKKGDHTFY